MTDGKNQSDVPIVMIGPSVAILPFAPGRVPRAYRRKNRPNANRPFIFSSLIHAVPSRDATVAPGEGLVRTVPGAKGAG